jgi:phage tail-like protein
MDSNQTRFHLVLGRDDWSRCTTGSGVSIFDFDAGQPPNFSWNDARSEVTLGVRASLFKSSPANVPPTLSQRRGSAEDHFGNWYLISDAGTELLVNSSGTSETTHFWASTDEVFTSCQIGFFGPVAPPTPPAPLAFSGLAITEHHYLIAGVLEPAGFVVFDLFHGGPPRQFVWPASIPFVPFDMAPAPGGGVWILDRINSRYWALDRTFAVIADNQSQINLSPGPDAFSAADGSAPLTHPAGTFPAGISLSMSSPLGSIDAIAIEALPDGSVLLLANPDPASMSSPLGGQFSLVYRFRNGQQLGDAVSLDSVLDILNLPDRRNFSLIGFDFAFIAAESLPTGSRQNTLYVASQNGDQSWAFEVSYQQEQLKLSPLSEYYPMRSFGGRGVVAGQTQVFYDSLDRWVPLIFQKRPRYVPEATLLTKSFDGKQPDCVWHRLMLDACLPPDTSIQVSSRAANDLDSLKTLEWTPEPGPYLRDNGTELPWTITPAGLGTWELLFQRASGQYLQLKLDFVGNGQTTPRVRTLRAYYPRFSYLEHYLPGVYREDQPSASFLDRFLANLEGFFTSIEDRVATVQALLDVRSAPNDALDWLANWFGVALDPAWAEAKRRLFLRHAPAFFEARGTVPGLLMALRLTLEDCADKSIFSNPTNDRRGVRIVENFSTRVLPLGLLQEPVSDSGLPVKFQTSKWTPDQGADDLDRRYREALKLDDKATYPISLSPDQDVFSQWTAFSMNTLGLVPAVPDDNSDLWMTFLRGRYNVITALNAAYRTDYGDFSEVPFPAELPRLADPLFDWYQFQGALLIQASAHQFTVFLPMPLGDAQNVMAHRAKMNLAQRVIDLEKPAHTSYKVKFYWAFFRVGDARLEEDSVLDYGSRSLQLLRSMVLGNSYVGSGLVSQTERRQFLRQRSC